MPEQPLENIRLDNIRLVSKGGGTKEEASRIPKEIEEDYPEPKAMPAYGIFARHVRDLQLANISTTFEKNDLRPAAAFDGIDGLQLENVRLQAAKGVSPAAILRNVRGLKLLDSPIQ